MLALIASQARAHGLATRGAFHPEENEGIAARTVVLLGFEGRNGWKQFAASPEAADGLPDPLDRWSMRIIEDLAENFGAEPLFPFGGPPWHPFQRWARRASTVTSSPIGLLIHPVYGLWHSYRGALVFAQRIEIPTPASLASPCDTCLAKPCLTTCPVDAFKADGYDVAACRTHVRSAAGDACRTHGCLARRACPVGPEHAYGPRQSEFLMRAFVEA